MNYEHGEFWVYANSRKLKYLERNLC